MTNKEKLKIAIEQDINPIMKIINQIEIRNNEEKNNIWKLSLISIYLVIVISEVLFLNYQKGTKVILKNETYKENNIILSMKLALIKCLKDELTLI